MKLYGSLTSPYARKLRVLLLEQPVACEFVVADPIGAASPVPKLNPLGKIPVLERDDGSVLFDSPVIFEYLDSLAPPSFLPAEGENRWQALLWQALADGVMDATVLHVIESRRPAEQQSAPLLSRQADKIQNGLAFANARVVGGEYLVGGRLSVADIAVVAALDYLDLRMPHAWRRQNPKLSQWHGHIAERASFVETCPPGLVRPEA